MEIVTTEATHNLPSHGCLIVVSGLPGSGKTTESKRLEVARRGVRFCPDDWMASLGANLWDSNLRANVESLQWGVALQILRSGGTAIIEWAPGEETNARRFGLKLRP